MGIVFLFIAHVRQHAAPSSPRVHIARCLPWFDARGGAASVSQMDDLYSPSHGHEDELLEQGSSIDALTAQQQASALTNPAERYDQLYGGKSSSQNSKPQPSPSTPTSLNRSGVSSDPRWCNFPTERDTTSEIRVTIWNSTQQRKISGNAAPMEKNVDDYLRKHPDCEIYNGQDKVPGAAKYDRNGHNGEE